MSRFREVSLKLFSFKSSYGRNRFADVRYDLYGVSNHSGTLYGGHYTASCRHPYK